MVKSIDRGEDIVTLSSDVVVVVVTTVVVHDVLPIHPLRVDAAVPSLLSF